MSTKRQKEKRITKQVRIAARWHTLLKVEAANNSTTLSKLLDEIIGFYGLGAESKKNVRP